MALAEKGEELVKKAAKKWALRAALTYLLPILGPILAVLAVAMVVILVLTSMCGDWKGRLLSAGAGLLAGADYCKAFEPFRGMANYIDTGNIPTISK